MIWSRTGSVEYGSGTMKNSVKLHQLILTLLEKIEFEFRVLYGF